MMKWLGKKSSNHRNISSEASGKDTTDCPELQNLQAVLPGKSHQTLSLPCGTVTCQAQIWMGIPEIPLEIPGIPSGFNTPQAPVTAAFNSSCSGAASSGAGPQNLHIPGLVHPSEPNISQRAASCIQDLAGSKHTQLS